VELIRGLVGGQMYPLTIAGLEEAMGVLSK
jgi:uncharacterized protein with von Willebrand factor type A (vWA) domain